MVAVPGGLSRLKKGELQEIAAYLGLSPDRLKPELVENIRTKLSSMKEIPESLAVHFPAGKSDGSESDADFISESENRSRPSKAKPVFEIPSSSKKLAKRPPSSPETPSKSNKSPTETLDNSIENPPFDVVNWTRDTYIKMRNSLSSSRMVVALFIGLEFYLFLKSFFPAKSEIRFCSAAGIKLPELAVLQSYEQFWKPFLLYVFYMNCLPFLGSLFIALDGKKKHGCTWSVFTFSVLRYAICFGYIIHAGLFSIVFQHIDKSVVASTCAVGIMFAFYEAIVKKQ